MTHKKSVVYYFSGNLTTLNSMDAERKTMLFLYAQFSKELKGCSLQIFTDSMTLV